MNLEEVAFKFVPCEKLPNSQRPNHLRDEEIVTKLIKCEKLSDFRRPSHLNMRLTRDTDIAQLAQVNTPLFL